MADDLILNTKNGQRLFNLSVHEDRLVLDIRRRYAAGEWVPYAELVMGLADYRKLLHWMFECDMDLEAHD